MAVWLSEDDIRDRTQDIFVFDLEWVGDVATSPSRCKIWEIGCYHYQTGDTFRIMIMPALTGDNFSIDHNGSNAVPPVTRAMIAEDSFSCSLYSGITSWTAWTKTISDQPIMLSHNCFSSDLPVLRAECMRCGCEMERWLFMDTLSFCRYSMRGRAQSFGIADLCTALNIVPEPHPHRALEDARMLANILAAIQQNNAHPISGTATTLCSIPVQAITGIGNKTACELRTNCGITSIWELYDAVMVDGLAFDTQNICEFMRNATNNNCTEFQCHQIAESAIKWAKKLGI